jgi:hypothetical protein
MRWERFFEDLEAEADGAVGAERYAEVADRTSREVGRQQLTDRLRVATEQEIVIRVSGAGLVRGTVASTGNGWVFVDENAGGQVLVPLRHVLAVGGLGPKAAVPGSEGRVGARLGIAYALRTLARDRAQVVVTLVDGGALSGVIARVGADFFDIADVYDAAEPAAVRALTAVPFEAMSAVKRGPA